MSSILRRRKLLGILWVKKFKKKKKILMTPRFKDRGKLMEKNRRKFTFIYINNKALK